MFELWIPRSMQKVLEKYKNRLYSLGSLSFSLLINAWSFTTLKLLKYSRAKSTYFILFIQGTLYLIMLTFGPPKSQTWLIAIFFLRVFLKGKVYSYAIAIDDSDDN